MGGISADKAYTGILSNSGGELAVLDAACNVSDLLAASSKWPGGSNVTKQTLERKTDLTWQTSAVAGGTPRAENSAGVIAASATVSSTEKYEVNVMISGDDSGQVIMKPGGTTCKESCTNEYAYGTTVTLTATPGNGAYFGGWSGGCAGTAGCSFMVGGPVLVNAAFESDIHGPPPADSGTDISEDVDISPPDSTSTAEDDPSEASSTDEEASSSSSSAIGHLVIAAVQIAGAAIATNIIVRGCFRSRANRSFVFVFCREFAADIVYPECQLSINPIPQGDVFRRKHFIGRRSWSGRRRFRFCHGSIGCERRSFGRFRSSVRMKKITSSSEKRKLKVSSDHAVDRHSPRYSKRS